MPFYIPEQPKSVQNSPGAGLQSERVLGRSLVNLLHCSMLLNSKNREESFPSVVLAQMSGRM